MQQFQTSECRFQIKWTNETPHKGLKKHAEHFCGHLKLIDWFSTLYPFTLSFFFLKKKHPKPLPCNELYILF